MLFLFFSGCCFAQIATNNDENKTVTPLYEIRNDKSFFDFYKQSNYGFILFLKFENKEDDYLDSIILSVENLQKYKSMDLDYYVSLLKSLSKDDCNIIESKKIENQGEAPYYLIVYEKTISKKQVKIYERIYFNNGFGFNFSLRTVTNKFDKLYSDSEEIFNSFKLLD